MRNRYRTLVTAATLLLVTCGSAAASALHLASLPPPEPPKPVDQSNSGPLLDDGSVVLEIRT